MTAMLETETKVYLIKAIPFHPEHELIVTNQTYWCVNDKPAQWRRSSKPELIEGVEDFPRLASGHEEKDHAHRRRHAGLPEHHLPYQRSRRRRSSIRRPTSTAIG
ncbi:MAG: hypothetical protein MZU97_09970 [Bacillus subtilis]|nr:hypothetical protein [Bacillus subtilis]